MPRLSTRLRLRGATAKVSLVAAVLALTCVTAGIGLAPAQAAGRPSRSAPAGIQASCASDCAGVAASGDAAADATASSVFTNTSLPTISGTPVEGETLSETHANWSSPPAGYAYQWQRCDSAGNNCQSVREARTQTYRLTAKDVGSTIRVAEDARNAAGAVTPSVSEPTTVVKAQATGGGGGSGGGGSGGDHPSGSPPGSCCNESTRVSPTKIRVLLARQLTPSSKAASLAALLKHRGVGMSFTFPEAGTLVVKWYLVPAGAKFAKRAKVTPTLVAAGQTTFTAAGARTVRIRLTAQGRKLLEHASRMRLEAKGTFAPKGGVAVAAAAGFALKR